MKRPAFSTYRTAGQAGVSLIELLVGLTIGALVSVVAVSSFSSTRTASTTLGDSTRLHQAASFAFHTIGHHLRQAGAQQLSDAEEGRVQFNSTFTGFGITGNPQALRGTEGGDNATDVLEISHDLETAINAVDCLGNNSVLATGITNRFEVFNGNLRCLGSGNSNPGPLIEGVEDFQVRYGVRTGGNLQYRNAEIGWNTNDWNAVESVLVCLRLAGQVGGHAGGAIAGCRENETIPNDGRIRRVFVRVFSIRNIAL